MRGTKQFEIKRGRYDDSSEADEGWDEEAPLGPVTLPQSITQEQEEDNLKKRFGVEDLPDGFQSRHELVGIHASGGITGPDRGRKGLVILLVIIILAVAGAAYWVHTQGGLDKVLGN